MNSQYIFNIGVLVAACLFVAGCSSMYIPPVPCTPLLEKQGEAQVDAATSTNSIYLTGAYAFSPKFAAMMNGNISYSNFSNNYDLLTPKNSGTDNSSILPTGQFTHSYGEAGIGSYNLLCSGPCLELFAGVGRGNAADLDKYTSTYTTGFIQGNVGKKAEKFHFEAGGTIRFAVSHFDFKYEPQFDSICGIQFNAFHFQPTGFIRFGSKSLRCIVRAGVNLAIPSASTRSVDFDRGIDNGYWTNTRLHVSVGFNYRFGYK